MKTTREGGEQSTRYEYQASTHLNHAPGMTAAAGSAAGSALVCGSIPQQVENIVADRSFRPQGSRPG